MVKAPSFHCHTHDGKHVPILPLGDCGTTHGSIDRIIESFVCCISLGSRSHQQNVRRLFHVVVRHPERLLDAVFLESHRGQLGDGLDRWLQHGNRDRCVCFWHYRSDPLRHGRLPTGTALPSLPNVAAPEGIVHRRSRQEGCVYFRALVRHEKTPESFPWQHVH